MNAYEYAAWINAVALWTSPEGVEFGMSIMPQHPDSPVTICLGYDGSTCEIEVETDTPPGEVLAKLTGYADLLIARTMKAANERRKRNRRVYTRGPGVN